MEFTQSKLVHFKVKSARRIYNFKNFNLIYISVWKTGIYEMANVYLDGNNLTRFESDVYQDILNQITLLGDLEDGGFVNVEGSTVNILI